jgi:hypothetical protein
VIKCNYFRKDQASQNKENDNSTPGSMFVVQWSELIAPGGRKTITTTCLNSLIQQVFSQAGPAMQLNENGLTATLSSYQNAMLQ